MSRFKTASVIYWNDEENLVLDGGGRRAQAWLNALRSDGIEATLHGLVAPASQAQEPSGQWSPGRLKRALVPMPLVRDVGRSAFEADIVINTVPASFASTLARGGSPAPVVLDWMDRWSVSARTLGDGHFLSLVGGRIQSRVWTRREKRLPNLAAANTTAGYGDASWVASNCPTAKVEWLPTPTAYVGRKSRRARGGHAGDRLGMIANFEYIANRYSFQRFADNYGDKLRESGAELVVGGFGCGWIADCARKIGAEVIGSVSSLTDFYQSIDYALVPIEHGSGIKVKAVEALANGVPVLGTDHVKDGFSNDLARHILSIDDYFSTATPLGHPGIDEDEFNRHLGPIAFNGKVARLLECM